MSCAPLQLSDEDEHRSGDVLLGDEIAPEQLASVERSTILLKEYDFLPRELYLVVDSRPGCGGVQWPAAEIMAKYLTHLHSQGTLESWTCQSILELGSGTGVLSMALATLLPQANIIATDMPQLLPLLQANIDLNQVQNQVKAMVLNWGEAIVPPLKPDIVLAADCVYLEITFPLLVSTLNEICTPDTLVLMSYKKRRRADKRFFNQLRKHFTWENVEDPARPTYARENLFLLKLQKKS